MAFTSGVSHMSSAFRNAEFHQWQVVTPCRQENIGIYAVFSGSGSVRCAKYAALTFPAELLFGQLNENQTPEQIICTLREAWRFVDKQYLASVDDLMLESVRIKIASENLVGGFSICW